MTLDPNVKVWRYMSLGKLLWLLQKKQLWLSRADLLDDRWEMMLDGPQLDTVMRRRPLSFTPAQVLERTSRIVNTLRKNTYVNSWTASEHESHALWRIYCPSGEGVAIQTTLQRLRDSTGLQVLEVTYGPHGIDGVTPDVSKLVAQKRPMFAYEREVRLVLTQDLSDTANPDRSTVGVGVDWDAEDNVENIWVHPEAQYWFMEAVTEAVRTLAPRLVRGGVPCVWWSKMNSAPPL